MLKISDPAPDFSLENQDGKKISSADFKGQWLLLYFYPKDNTPGCTKEACGLRDSFDELKRYLEIVGVSKDSVKSHSSFVDKYDLPFDLLSDPSTEMIQAYRAWGKKKFMGKEFEGILRISYLIDPEGKVRKVYPKVKPAQHAEEILNDIKELKS